MIDYRTMPALPDWPPDWIEDFPITAEQVLLDQGGVTFTTATRADEWILFAARWPGGRRWLLADPSGEVPPEALRAGELAEDPEVARVVEAVWSQALTLTKRLLDGDFELPGDEPQGKRRPWRRGQ